MFIKIFRATVAILFGGAFGFAAGGIVFALAVSAIAAVYNGSNPMPILDSEYSAHPWGIIPVAICTGELVTTIAGAWVALKVSRMLRPIDPPDLQTKSRFALVLFLVMLALALPPLIRFPLRATSTPGTIVQLYPQDHATVDYGYSVRSRSFERRGHPQTWQGIHPGMKVPVYYLPDNPAVSSLREPTADLWPSLGGTVMVTTFLSIWLAYAFAGLRKVLSNSSPGICRATNSPPRMPSACK